MFSFEDWRLLLYRLKVLYRCLRIKFSLQKIINLFSTKIFKFFGHQKLGSGSGLIRKPGFGVSEYGSGTLFSIQYFIICKLLIVYEQYEELKYGDRINLTLWIT
jgi:hypothetical protein